MGSTIGSRESLTWSTWQKVCCRGFTLVELLIVLAMIATLTAIGVPVYANAVDRAKITKAIGDIHTFQTEIELYQVYNARFPDSLTDIGRGNFRDPYGNPYKYLNFANAKKSNKWGGTKEGTEKPRKDRYLVPLNEYYDLYSMGKDGESKEDLAANESLDDIVRANYGGYIGLASDY